MKTAKKSKYQAPKIKTTKVKNIQFYSRSNYPNSTNSEYDLLAYPIC